MPHSKKAEKRALLNEIREWTGQQPFKGIQALGGILLLDILQIDMLTEQFNKELFVSYLESPINWGSLYLNQEYRVLLQNKQDYYNVY